MKCEDCKIDMEYKGVQHMLGKDWMVHKCPKCGTTLKSAADNIKVGL